MHLLLLILLQVFAVLSIGSALVYAPFAKGWLRALLVPAALAFLWTVTRVAIMLAFADPDVPLFGVAFAPFGAVLYAALARTVKRLLFSVPPLAEWENRFRARFMTKHPPSPS